METNKNNILNIINNNDWTTALESVKNYFDPINTVDGKNIFHYACMRGKKDIIYNILELNTHDIFIADNNGNTGAHLLAMGEWDNILLDIVKKKPLFLKLRNNDDMHLFDIVLNRIETFKKNVKLMKQHNYLNYLNFVNGSNKTIIHSIIDTIDDNIDSPYIKLLKKMYKYGINFEIPKSNPILTYVIREKYYNVCIYILDNFDKLDVNIKTTDQFTPLIGSIIRNNEEIALKLISRGADVNYSGLENKFVPLSLCFEKGLINVAKKILEKENVIYDKKNIFLETPIYYLIKYCYMNINIYKNNSQLKKILRKMIKNSDLLNLNINKITPFHLLTKYNLWKDFKKILINKKFDVNALDKNNTTPISYIQKDDMQEFTNFMDDVIKKGKNKFVLGKKVDIILPEIINDDIPFGLFNADFVHYITYLIHILKKYPNVIIPVQYPLFEKKVNDVMKINQTPDNKLMRSYGGTSKMHHTTFYSFIPHILLWENRTNYYKHYDMITYLQRAINSGKHRFVVLKITIVIGSSLHANIVIYDKTRNIVLRFEPYGDWEFSDSYFLDKKIINIFKKALNQSQQKFKYLRPIEYLDKVKFQSSSLGDLSEYKNLGDPAGYCLAWCMWFLELKIKNPDIDERTLVENALSKIVSEADNYNYTPLLNYIRGYSKYLDNEKNIILKKLNINKYDVYKLTYTDEFFEIFKNFANTFSISHFLT